MPKVSIIIPCYKVEKYLKRCLDSVLAQTFCEWEAICVNDGSPDNCGAILDEYARKDSRFKIIYQENQGVSAARNNGLQHANGDFISFIDSDDEISPVFLEKMLEALQKRSEAGFAWCDFEKGENKTEWNFFETSEKIYDKPFDHYVQHQKPKIVSSIWNKLYRKNLLENLTFSEDLSVGEDLIFLYQVLHRAKYAVYIHSDMYFYRTRENSAMTKPLTKKRLDDELLIAIKLSSMFDNNTLDKKTKKDLEHYIAKRLFGYVVKFTKKKDKKNYNKWLTQYLPVLKELEKQGIFRPRNLSIKNRIIYYWLTKTQKNNCRLSED